MPRLDPIDARTRFAASRVARLATADADGRPHLVPVTFAVLPARDGAGDVITIAVDHKPKTTTNLKRLANIAENPAVCLLVDRYDDDWSQLWWARADGTAAVLPPGAPEQLAALAERYPPYRSQRPEGPVIVVTVSRWSGWSAT